MAPTAFFADEPVDIFCRASHSSMVGTSDQISILLLELERSHRSRASKRCQSWADGLVFDFAIGSGSGNHTLVVVHEKVLLRIRVHALMRARRDGWVCRAFVRSRLDTAVGRRVVGGVEARERRELERMGVGQASAIADLLS
jgi:hypothetical protein